MANRRSVRADKRDEDEELPEEPEDDLADEPEDDGDLANEPEDDLAEEPEGDLADEPADDGDLADEPEDDLADEPEDDLADEEPSGAGRRSRRGHGAGLTAAEAGRAALRHIAGLTGKELEGVTGVEPVEDTWVVGVEVVEDRRIPSSTDILATYETELDLDGELVSYRRVRRYTRGRGDNGDS